MVFLLVWGLSWDGYVYYADRTKRGVMNHTTCVYWW
jgi:hypothetical protein